jgi:putative tricarboxylic transport membrane protein
MKYSVFNRQSMIGWILLVLSILYGINALTFPEGMSEPGPSFLPIILSIGAVICSIVIIFKNRVIQASEDNPEYKIGKQHLLLVGYLAAYLILVPFLGFIITSVLFLVVIFRLYGVNGYLRPIIYSAVLTASVYVLFRLVLNVPLDLM